MSKPECPLTDEEIADAIATVDARPNLNSILAIDRAIATAAYEKGCGDKRAILDMVALQRAAKEEGYREGLEELWDEMDALWNSGDMFLPHYIALLENKLAEHDSEAKPRTERSDQEDDDA